MKFNEELICTLDNGNRYIPYEKLMKMDVLNIHLS